MKTKNFRIALTRPLNPYVFDFRCRILSQWYQEFYVNEGLHKAMPKAF